LALLTCECLAIFYEARYIALARENRSFPGTDTLVSGLTLSEKRYIISDMMDKKMPSLADRVMRRARAHAAQGARLVFTPKDFLDLGSRAAVDQALSRLTKCGALRRVRNGLYDIPRVNPILKRPAAPDIDAVVDAIARRDDVTIVPNGMAAANRLGLTNAVSVKNVYLTDGPSRRVKVGNRVVHLKHAGPKQMSLKDRPAGDVVRALHWLGPKMAGDDAIIDALRRRLPPKVKLDLARAKPGLAGWTSKVTDQVAA
jgi:hypothetical protein